MINISKLTTLVNVAAMNGRATTPLNSDEIKFVVGCYEVEDDDCAHTCWFAQIMNASGDEDGEDVPVYWTIGSKTGDAEQLLDAAPTMLEAIARLDASIGRYMAEIGI